ncbi:hypothetical protein [Sphingomonas sp. PP-CC-3A-396]|uniref:hypothetical protein n=1 Tax=Sphingomonas sp. PP-CC-3A-396 TaxID=2135655 RepID=UPI0010472E73|nr:hypothetical protein [Sphingomonas sp. PP-CC-3A-396]
MITSPVESFSAGWLSRMSKACPKVAAPCACAGFLTPGLRAGSASFPSAEAIVAGNTEHKIRELLDALREGRQPGSVSTELEDSLLFAMTKIPLNRPTGMGCSRDVYVEWMAEEAEQFVSLAGMLTLELHDGFSGHQRFLLGKIVADLRHNLERFISDVLLIAGDRQEIRRRIEAG